MSGRIIFATALIRDVVLSSISVHSFTNQGELPTTLAVLATTALLVGTLRLAASVNDLLDTPLEAPFPMPHDELRGRNDLRKESTS